MTTYETASIMLTIIGCTWAICQRIAACVTREECASKRTACHREWKKKKVQST